jgi:uncharacterized protein YciI
MREVPMPLFAVLFEDEVVLANAVRQRHMAAHLAFLERHAASVRAAGPLREVDGAAAGGLWLVEAAGASEVDALIREDPFWPTGLRRSHRVLEWNRVFVTP